MGGTEILLIAAVVLIPLAIAVAVTLWTLEPAARRAERAKRGRKRSRPVDTAGVNVDDQPFQRIIAPETGDRDDRTTGTP